MTDRAGDLSKRRALLELGQRAIDYYVDTGFCVFCDADDCAGKPHEDHCNRGALMRAIVYHPDPDINESVRVQAIEGDLEGMQAGHPPLRWCCPECARSHSRGYFLAVGQHRCLWCGYQGAGGVLWDPKTELDPAEGDGPLAGIC